jgi:spermidine synthase
VSERKMDNGERDSLESTKISTNLLETLSPTLVGLIVTISGFCSLAYQVVWDRTLRYNFGGDSVSSAIVTGTFLLGLGIGALVFGKWRQRPFTTYALIEIGIGAYAIVSFHILSSLATMLGNLFHYTIADVEGLRSIVIVACILFLLPPCILMGGTLPLIFNCFVRPGFYDNRRVGFLYGLNTAGASFGILAVIFLFLNRISLPATLQIVGGCNILLGVGVWFYGRSIKAPNDRLEPPEAQPVQPVAMEQMDLSPLLALGFLSGFFTLAYEITLFRTVGIMLPSSPYVFPIVLMPFLLSLAIGSLWFTKFRDYAPGPALKRVGSLFILSVAAIMVGVLIRYFWRFYFYLWSIPLALFMGGVFPLLLRLAASRGQDLPRSTGSIYLANAVGAFLGAILSQFVGFPLLGTRGVLLLLFGMGLLAGGWCLVRAEENVARPALNPATWQRFARLALVLPIPFLLPTPMWEIYTFNYTGPEVDKVEGLSGVATIRWRPGESTGEVRVNGQYMSVLPDHPKHIRLAGAVLAMPQRKKVLILGLGGGGMVRELLKDPAIQQIDIVDWSGELPRVLDSFRARADLAGALSDPRVRLFRADARVAVSLYEEDAFDLVIDNLAIVGWTGSTSIKSTGYFAQVARIIKPGGVFVFDPNYFGSPDREAVLAGLMDHFPYVQEHRQAVLVLAAAHPIDIEPQRAEEVMRDRGRALELAEPYSDWLLKGFRPITQADLNGTPPIRDDLLIYEYRLYGDLPPDFSSEKRVPRQQRR